MYKRQIDALENKVIATIEVGQQPQALVYVPDAVRRGDGLANLSPLGVSGESAHLSLAAPASSMSEARATVSVNSLGTLDLLQAAVSGLVPGEHYTLWLTEARDKALGIRDELTSFQTNLSGAQIAQAIGPFRSILADQGEASTRRRFLLITRRGSELPVLVQQTP